MIMDYEKKYKDSLEKARYILHTVETAGCAMHKDLLEEIFPELRESEDERIRKEMIDFLKSEKAFQTIDLPISERWIAYLEKQKEASKAMEAVDRIDKYIDEHVANAHDMKDSNPDKKYYRGWDDALGKMAGILQDVYSGEKQKEQIPITESKRLANEVIEYLTKCGYAPVLKDDSKKGHFHIDIPRHEDDFWQSEEYRHCCNVLGEYYMEGDYGCDTYTLYIWRTKKEQKPTLNWRTIEQATTKRTDEGDCVTTERMLIKGLIDDEDYRIIDKDVMVNKNLLCIPVSELNAKEQKPVEWSEKDEYILNSLIRLFSIEYGAKVWPWSIGCVTYGDVVRFLESLKNRGNFPKSNTNSPNEWTEEEKDNVIKYLHEKDGGMLWSKATEITEEILEILHPQPHWKPSEEQMEALNAISCHGELTYTNQGQILIDLYNDLKKLCS